MAKLFRLCPIFVIPFLLLAAAPGPNIDWPVYGGAGGQHYSALTQIDRGNVAKLSVAWSFDTGRKADCKPAPSKSAVSFTALRLVPHVRPSFGLTWAFHQR